MKTTCANMDTIDDRLAVIQPLNKFWYHNKVAALDMLRLDLLHPVMSGNKWYKLRLNMKHAVESNFKTIVTFGGGFSNHLIASAYAAKLFGLKSAGIVRGRYDTLTPTLLHCKKLGMELLFVSKEEYRQREDSSWIMSIAAHFDEIFIIPEGGANEWGRTGAGLISRFIKEDYSHIALAVGTGTTLTGLRNKVSAAQAILGFVPLKEGTYLKEYIMNHLLPEKNKNWELHDNWHFGGFGKWDKELLIFMNDFYKVNNIPLDIVYTSKMMYGLKQMLEDNIFSSCDKILCIHTGGLQGNVSVKGELCY